MTEETSSASRPWGAGVGRELTEHNKVAAAWKNRLQTSKNRDVDQGEEPARSESLKGRSRGCVHPVNEPPQGLEDPPRKSSAASLFIGPHEDQGWVK